MPVGERLFRVVWLGPVGRTFIRLSARGVAPRVSGGAAVVTTPGVGAVAAARPAAAPSNGASPVATDRVSALEARVAALEHWRDGA